MGVVNVTPDSFSDGGRHASVPGAVAHALALVQQGAQLLDVGGESTRPGAEPVPEAEELARVVPVIRQLTRQTAVPISIDTRKPAVARAAVAAGAAIWNDVTALTGHRDSPAVAAELGCRVVLMHMQGEPRTMQAAPAYADAVAEVEAFLLARAEEAEAAGVLRSRILLDPGIGFGKTPEHSFALLQGLPRMVAHGYPVLLGVSRKRLIQAADPTAADPLDRLGGSLAGALWGAHVGVAAVRVHDVRETAQALSVWSRIDACGAPVLQDRHG
jgi:dihydropteroate synthase